MRLYSLLETNLDVDQFLKTMHRYIHLGVHIKGYMSKKYGRFQREIVEVAEFYVDKDNKACTNVLSIQMQFQSIFDSNNLFILSNMTC